MIQKSALSDHFLSVAGVLAFDVATDVATSFPIIISSLPGATEFAVVQNRGTAYHLSGCV